MTWCGDREQVVVADGVRHVTLADEHDVLEPGLLLHPVDEAGEEAVDEAHLGARVAQHVGELLRREPQVQAG